MIFSVPSSIFVEVLLKMVDKENVAVKPSLKFVCGGVSASVWDNPVKDSNGESFISRKVSFEKSYKDKDGEWCHSQSFDLSDIPKLKSVLDRLDVDVNVLKFD